MKHLYKVKYCTEEFDDIKECDVIATSRRDAKFKQFKRNGFKIINVTDATPELTVEKLTGGVSEATAHFIIEAILND